jgi:anti-sigma factor (TIGR02949 family)
MKIENACREAQQLCDPYIDGELSHEARLSLLRHLAACDACAESVKQRALLKRLIRSAATNVVVPAPVRLRIVGGIRAFAS